MSTKLIIARDILWSFIDLFQIQQVFKNARVRHFVIVRVDIFVKIYSSGNLVTVRQVLKYSVI